MAGHVNWKRGFLRVWVLVSLFWFGSILVVSWNEEIFQEAKVFLDGRHYSLSEAQKLVPNVGDTDGERLTVQE